MKLNRNAIILGAVATISFAAGHLGLPVGNETAAAAQPRQDESPPEMTPEMQAMLNVASPGAHHRVLDQFIGEWTGEFTIRMGPDADPIISRGTVEREWILGGRYVRETVRAQSEAGDFEGIGYLGFNNFDGRFEIVWLDSMSTAIHFETGTYHPDEKVMHFRSDYRDPVSGRLINSWTKLELSDPDRHIGTGYATDADGRTFKAMEGVLMRKH